MNHSHASHTGTMSTPRYCPFNHPAFYSLECSVCNHQASEGYKMEQARLVNIRGWIDAYFQLPNVGALTLDHILTSCMKLQPIVDHLSNYDEGSIEYYLQQAKIVHMIKQNIGAYIDGKMTPEGE
jgi:hypothetical protein